MSLRFGLIFIVFYVAFARLATSTQHYYFGLTSSKSDMNLKLHSNTTTSVICASLGLNKWQKDICRKETEIAKTLAKAMSISVKECDHQFQHDRWNCSLGPTRLKLIKKGCKEASFLFAVTSASLVHTVARACKSGKLDRCSCGLRINHKNRLCGDNIEYAKNFTRRFLQTTTKRGRLDARTEVDVHNLNVGIRAVTSSTEESCKCHSALRENCADKSCVYKLANFRHIGDMLKSYYQNATKHVVKNHAGNEVSARKRKKNQIRKNRRLGVKRSNVTQPSVKKRKHVAATNQTLLKPTLKANKKRRSKRRHHKKKDRKPKKLPKTKLDVNKMSLKFSKKSPDFCVKSVYSEGVSGRQFRDKEIARRVCCKKYVECCTTPGACDCFRCK